MTEQTNPQHEIDDPDDYDQDAEPSLNAPASGRPDGHVDPDAPVEQAIADQDLPEDR